MEAIGKQAIRVIKLFGNEDVKAVHTTVGPEQEYFLIDENDFIILYFQGNKGVQALTQIFFCIIYRYDNTDHLKILPSPDIKDDALPPYKSWTGTALQFPGKTAEELTVALREEMAIAINNVQMAEQLATEVLEEVEEAQKAVEEAFED